MNRFQTPRALVCLTTAAALFVFAASASARPGSASAPAPCSGTAKGAAWTYKGHKGTAYSVIGVSGASCTTGLQYMAKWTRDSATFQLRPVPAGWHCSAIGDYSSLAKLGQCTTPKGGIFEWLPKQTRKPDERN